MADNLSNHTSQIVSITTECRIFRKLQKESRLSGSRLELFVEISDFLIDMEQCFVGEYKDGFSLLEP